MLESRGTLAAWSRGSTVAFASYATNLDPADKDPNSDVFVKTLTTGDLVLASTSDAGVKGNSDSENPSLSADGDVVAFDSRATNLDPADSESNHDGYVKDVVTRDLLLVSVAESGVKGNWPTRGLALSANGRVAVAQTPANNLVPGDTDYFFDIYLWNVRPTAAFDSYNAVEDHPMQVSAPGVLTNDSDAWDHELTATLERGPAHGDVVLSLDGAFTYTPDHDFSGTDSFTYRAHGRFSAPATVLIRVYPGPAISINDRALNEGTKTTTAFAFSVTLDEAASKPVTVTYRTFDGSAVSPTDYAAVSGTVTFAPGQTTRTIVVQVVGDGRIESDERFMVWLTKSPGAVIIDDVGYGMILNDDG